MPVTPSGPSALLKTYAFAVSWAFRILAVCAVLLALVWLLIHGFIVPRIADLRPQLEARASAQLGLRVHIGAVSGESQGWVPSFELHDVRLLDAQGQTALHLPRVLATLSPRSLWNLGFEQLAIEGPVLEVRRTPDGRLWLAGLDMSQTSTDTGALDWLLSQTEVAVRQGTLRWTDEHNQLPPLELTGVSAVLRNHLRTHELRVDADPPSSWGERLSWQARFRQPILSTRASDWQRWSGQVYAAFGRVDLGAMAPYLGWPDAVPSGQGAVRAWVDMNLGRLSGVTADVALSDLTLRLRQDLPALAFQDLSGRVALHPWGRDGLGHEFLTQNLAFTLADGLRWPGGNLSVRQASEAGSLSQRSELSADRLDLQALAAIARRLPQAAPWHEQLQSLAPQGQVELLQLSWLGQADAPAQVKAQGRVSGLALAAQPAQPRVSGKSGTTVAAQPGRPGVQGATLSFEGNLDAGKAKLSIEDGATTFPGVFDEPQINWRTLSSDITWQHQGEQLQVQLPNLKFAQADLQGEASVKWRTGAERTLPGVLDLQGTLSHAELNQVHRYLPLVMSREVRDYLREALVRGQASAVKVRLKGDLWQLPYRNGDGGQLKISARVRDAVFNPAPAVLNTPSRWPLLSQVNAELNLDNARLSLKDISGRWAANTNSNTNTNTAAVQGIRFQRGEVVLANLLNNPTVQVQTELRAAVPEVLSTIRHSTLQDITQHFLDEASGSGPVEANLKLTMPLQDMGKTQALGRVTLAGNELNLSPDIPAMSKVRGQLWFSEDGLAVQGAQARLLGGDALIEGGSMAIPGQSSRAFNGFLRVQGTATAEGLRGLNLGGLNTLLARSAGSTPYTAQIGLRGPSLDLQVNSNLLGMALDLPAPLGKTAASSLPLRVDITPVDVSTRRDAAPGKDRVRVAMGRMLSAVYIRELGDEPRVLQGLLQFGEPINTDQPLPARGVAAVVEAATLDADAWLAVMDSSAHPSLSGRADVTPTSAVSSYMPRTFSLKAQRLMWQGRTLNKLTVNAARETNQWRAQVDAQELNGLLEYRPGEARQPGRLFARLTRLSLAASTAKEVESLLEEQPVSMPGLDIVVDDLELRGKRLGRVEIEAINRGSVLAREGAREGVREGRNVRDVREWQLQKFNIIAPEGTFTATGRWAGLPERTPVPRAPSHPDMPADLRRTSMNFKLDITDGGDLLARLGLSGVLRDARGRMEGHIDWMGSPITPDYPSMNGQFNVNIEGGQFLKVEPGIAKLLGVLNLQALPRRLTLDFRDVFSDGFAFDFVRGDVRIEQGMASTNNLQMKGVNAAVLMEGRADLARETQDLHVVVVPEINAGTASLIATYINPAVGLGSFLAQLILRRPLMASTTKEFYITGPWVDPKITTASSKNESDKPSKDEVKP